MLELLGPKAGEKILDIGSGSSWQTALLSYIVSHDEFGKELPREKQGMVIGVELIPELAQFGRKSIFPYSFIKKGITEIHCLNAGYGFPKYAPYDRIIAAAAGTAIPEAWKQQLCMGGVLVAPVGSKIIRMQKVSENKWEEDVHEGFVFVPFITEENNGE
jgi:protein-L-isoaspartate(D-aspartate) O-methyltransferase